MVAARYGMENIGKVVTGMARKVTSGSGGGRNKGSIDYGKLARLGMSPRQQLLNHLWAWYRSEHYGARKVDWTGQEVMDPIEHEAVATQGFLPAGFVDMGENLPIKFRKPSASYSLARVVVDRFTAMLFSARSHPFVYVEGDPDTNDYIGALIETSRLWPAMLLARQYGGAMGAVCIGFQFINGKPEIEVHDPRWTNPVFADRSTFSLRAIEKRYMYPQEERDQETGAFITVWYWYRRTIDEAKDVLYVPAPVGDGSEPDWQVARASSHGFGFCPCIWVQNLPVQDDTDGDPDCHGIYETIEAMDALLAQANKGTISNCDPTLVVTSDEDIPGLKKGSENALKLMKGDSANYLELSGSGPEAALKMFEVFRKCALEVTQCVLDHPDAQNRTATEIEKWYSGMLAKVDVLREQYGQRGVMPLVEMMLLAARKLDEGKLIEGTNEIERQVLLLPPRVVEQEDGTIDMVPRKLGQGGILKIKWQRYFQYTLAEVELAVRAAGSAMAAGLLDLDNAVRFISEYFGITDAQELVAKLLKAKKSAEEGQQAGMFGYLRGSSAGAEPKPEPEPEYEWEPEEEPEEAI